MKMIVFIISKMVVAFSRLELSFPNSWNPWGTPRGICQVLYYFSSCKITKAEIKSLFIWISQILQALGWSQFLFHLIFYLHNGIRINYDFKIIIREILQTVNPHRKIGSFFLLLWPTNAQAAYNPKFSLPSPAALICNAVLWKCLDRWTLSRVSWWIQTWNCILSSTTSKAVTLRD